MKAIKFKESNHTYAEHQEEYNTLHVWHSKDMYGEVISCWQPSLWQRLSILFRGRVYLSVLTFNKALQPQRMQTTFKEAKINMEK